MDIATQELIAVINHSGGTPVVHLFKDRKQAARFIDYWFNEAGVRFEWAKVEEH